MIKDLEVYDSDLVTSVLNRLVEKKIKNMYDVNMFTLTVAARVLSQGFKKKKDYLKSCDHVKQIRLWSESLGEEKSEKEI